MRIENTFIIDASVDRAWALLTDIAEIAPCLPGAALTGEEDGVYSGSVKIKVGPVTACLLYTSPSPRDATLSRMPSSA